MATKEFVALDGLTRYHQLLSGVMSTEDAKAIKVVTVSNNVVNFYKTETATGTPAYTVTLPTVSDFIHKISNAHGGRVPTTTSAGEISESDWSIGANEDSYGLVTGYLGGSTNHLVVVSGSGDHDVDSGNLTEDDLVVWNDDGSSTGYQVIVNTTDNDGTVKSSNWSIGAHENNAIVTGYIPGNNGDIVVSAYGSGVSGVDIKSSGVNISSLATKAEVGSIPSGSSATSIVDYIDEQVGDLDNSLGTAAFEDVPTSGNASTSQVVMGNDTRLSDARQASDVYSWAKAENKPTYTASEVGAIATTAKGANNGVAELDSTGRVPSSQLPSYVDDVIEGYYYNNKFYEDSAHTTEITGQAGKIYVDLVSNKTYRWTGTGYAEISESLALGETSSTAYRGDRGKTAYDHSQVTSGNPHNVTKSDVGLGNVGNFKAVSTVASQGLTSTEKSNARTNIGLGTAAVKDVPASGNASSSQVVLGSDTRVTDEPTLRAAFDALGFSVVNGKLCQTYTA